MKCAYKELSLLSLDKIPDGLVFHMSKRGYCYMFLGSDVKYLQDGTWKNFTSKRVFLTAYSGPLSMKTYVPIRGFNEVYHEV